MFDSRIPVCCWISLEPSVPYQSLSGVRGAGKPLPGQRSTRWDACRGFPSLAFPFGERGYLQPSFDMDRILALWSSLLLASLVTCKVWSLDLYLKKLPVYILLQNSIKHPCSIRAWVPVCLFLSLFLADSPECKGRLRNPGNINLFFHFLIIDSRPPGSSLLKDTNTLSFIVSLNLLKFMSIELIVPSNHIILYCLHLLIPSIFPNIRVFSNEWSLYIRWPKY